MTFVSYDDALDHAERVGKRLPDEFEFEFAATNGGTVADPWAGQGEPADAWEIGPFEKSRFPLQVGNRTVYGLFSNVVEWTSSWAANYPGLRHHPAQKLGGEERIVRGGPASALGFSDAPKGYRGPRMRIMQLRQAFGPGLGFRCARSDKPRLTPADFGRIIPDGESTAP
jgi:formylglycine-generating enzyme required for sulfatase activity